MLDGMQFLCNVIGRKRMMDKDIIRKHMEKLQDKIKYRFHNVKLLEEAMYAERVHTENEGRNHKEYTNDKIAIVGDSVLKLVLSDFLFCNPAKYNIRDMTIGKRIPRRIRF